ncbi:type I-E CRISPR-associated protein Cse2/CasB [Filomicrobium sp.]|uniref:type I-E CRISPR-associated protein Cse2/CasB n=1 Tax=Filomicrobium sp. TaxID=2024831 RepID=UPI00258A383D|nr:type I-E CRISPR-associated protein Cse2/CasB [Filomicrobium sp.]MCV0369521.1 type I-E CRISPR-associated protein Cse2/CasB [Filomicrobium sp.]
MSNEPFKEEKAAVLAWWRQLQPQDAEGRSTRGDRAAIARLKRVPNILEAAAEPAAANLYRRVGFTRPSIDLPRAALLAAVLAHVKKDDPLHPVAEAIGAPRSGDETAALISPLRFKRIVSAREPDELLIVFRRVVAILGGRADIKNIAAVLLGFTDARWGDITRTQFAFAYHGASLAAPKLEAEQITI